MLLEDASACAIHEQSCAAVFSCPGCEALFASRRLLEAHVRRVPKLRSSCTAEGCIACATPFRSREERLAHEARCWQVLTCPGCQTHFAELEGPSGFQAHLSQRNKASSESSAPECTAFQCPVCGIVFGSPEEGEHHAKSHRVGKGVRKKRPQKGADLGSAASWVLVARPSSGRARPSCSPTSPKSPNLAQLDATLLQVDEIVDDINAQVAPLEGSALRQRLRQLQFLWHPDRACRLPEIDASLACHIFAHVQSLWVARVQSGG